MYYIYFNWRADGEHMRIHYGNCPFCNNGNGRHIDNVEPGAQGVWIGSFAQMQYVVDFIQRCEVLYSHCEVCNPQ